MKTSEEQAAMRLNAKNLADKFPQPPRTSLAKNKRKNPKLSARRKAEYAVLKAHDLLLVQKFELVESVVTPAIKTLNEGANWYPDLHAELFYLWAMALIPLKRQVHAKQALDFALRLACDPELKRQVIYALNKLPKHPG